MEICLCVSHDKMIIVKQAQQSCSPYGSGVFHWLQPFCHSSIWHVNASSASGCTHSINARHLCNTTSVSFALHHSRFPKLLFIVWWNTLLCNTLLSSVSASLSPSLVSFHIFFSHPSALSITSMFSLSFLSQSLVSFVSQPHHQFSFAFPAPFFHPLP